VEYSRHNILWSAVACHRFVKANFEKLQFVVTKRRQAVALQSYLFADLGIYQFKTSLASCYSGVPVSAREPAVGFGAQTRG